MRTTILALALALLVVAALPTGTADREVDLEVALDAHHTSTTASAPTDSTLSLPAASPMPLPEETPDLLELTAVKTDSSAEAGGFGLAARAGNEFAKRSEQAARAILPAVEKAAPPVVATAGFFALLQALGVWRFLALGSVGLYSRLTKSDLLDNAHRDRVYKLIQEEPGLGVSQIAERTQLGWGTTVYHLDRLQRAGFVAPERGGLHKCFYPVGMIAREVRKGMGVLKADTTRSVAAFLLTKPGATQSELCAALGLSPSAASKQVSKLEEAGLVRRERDWKNVRLIPHDTLAPLLAGPAPLANPTPMSLAPIAA